MKPIAAALSLTLLLAACGSPKEEDKLSPDDIRASESAPELPDVALSENPEPEPAPPAVAPPANEAGNAIDESEDWGSEAEPPPPPGTALIPAAFHGRWGMSVEDCTDPRREGSTALSVDTQWLELPDGQGRLSRTLGSFPERFVGIFNFNGDRGRWSATEELSLTGSSNVLIRDTDGERFRYRRCVRPKA